MQSRLSNWQKSERSFVENEVYLLHKCRTLKFWLWHKLFNKKCKWNAKYSVIAIKRFNIKIWKHIKFSSTIAWVSFRSMLSYALRIALCSFLMRSFAVLIKKQKRFFFFTSTYILVTYKHKPFWYNRNTNTSKKK